MATVNDPKPSEPEKTTPSTDGSAAPAPNPGRAKEAAGNAAAAAAVGVVKAIVTRNAGEAAKTVGASAAQASAKNVASGAAKAAATDVAKETTKSAAADTVKDAAKSTADNLFSNVKQDASKSAVGQAKGLADSIGEGDLKGTAGKALKAVSADSEDDSIKGTVANTVKGAVGGAAGGAIAGGVGAIPGAVVGAASGLLANKKGRALVIALVVVIIVIPALVAAFWFGSFVMVSSSMLSGMQAASAESVKSSGFTEEEVRDAIRKGGNTLAPWQMVKAIEKESNAEVNGPLLNEEMRKVDSSLASFEMGAGTGYAPGATWRSVGESPQDKAAADTVREQWLKVLTAYSESHSLNPEKTYNLALAWYLGEKLESCTPGTMPELGEHTFTLPDGSTRTLTDVQMKNAGDIYTEAQKIEGINANALTIMYMAALVESGLKNYANKTIPESLTYPHDAVGQDHDSVGFWQMRRHWATPYGDMSKLMSVPYQVSAILGGPNGPNYPSPRGIFDIRDWETRDKGEVAQAVEVSAFPDKYALQEDIATELVKYLSGGGAIGSCGGNLIVGDFAHPLGDGTKFGISSVYGPRDSMCNGSGCASSFHRGLDYGATCDTPLYAIAPGTVTRTGVNGGWGNVVEYDMDDGTKLRYAHQPYGTSWPAVGSKVVAGQQIGQVGKTGVSFGCHLHLEILVGGTQVDPFPWMVERGLDMTFQTKNMDGYVPGYPSLW